MLHNKLATIFITLIFNIKNFATLDKWFIVLYLLTDRIDSNLQIYIFSLRFQNILVIKPGFHRAKSGYTSVRTQLYNTAAMTTLIFMEIIVFDWSIVDVQWLRRTTVEI